MKLDFVNSKIYAKVFLTLMLSTIFIMSISYTTNYLYERYFGEFQFEPGAKIGPVLVEGLTRSEAVEKVGNAVKTWTNNPLLTLSWNGKDLPVSSSVVIFDIPTSVENAPPAGTPRLFLSIGQEALGMNASQLMGKDEIANLDHAKLEKSILHLAASLPSEKVSIPLKDYLKSQPISTMVVSKGIVVNKEKKQIDSSLLTRLNGYTINPGESFSLLSVMQKKELSDDEVYSFNLAASGIYQMLLHTNFEIIERHTGRSLPIYSELGYEASVIPDHWDFVFKNPNPTPYTLKTSYKNDQLEVLLQGAALPAHYEPYLFGKKELPPKTIVHMNPYLSNDEIVTKETGKLGYVVQVYRHKLQGGQLVGKELVSEDFYPPVHRLEERGPSTPVVIEPEGNEQQESDSTIEEEDSNSKPSNESDWVILQ